MLKLSFIAYRLTNVCVDGPATNGAYAIKHFTHFYTSGLKVECIDKYGRSGIYDE